MILLISVYNLWLVYIAGNKASQVYIAVETESNSSIRLIHHWETYLHLCVPGEKAASYAVLLLLQQGIVTLKCHV